MKRAFFLTLIPALLVLAFSGSVAWADCPCGQCGGPACCESCGDCGGDCGCCDRGCGCGCPLLAPIGWVARVLGLSCPCGGCDRELYWGDCQRGCDRCDRCGHFVGGGGCGCGCGGGCGGGCGCGDFQGGAVYEGSYRAAPQPGCNCGNSYSYRRMPTQGVYANQYQYRTAPANGYARQNTTRQVSGVPADPRPRVLSVTDHVVVPADNR